MKKAAYFIAGLCVTGLTLADSAAAVSVGAGTFVLAGCDTPDAIAFTAADNGDGSWTFSVVDVGTGACAWFWSADLVGVGSLAAGFDGTLGEVDSGPWTCSGSTCSVTGMTLIFDADGVGLAGNYQVTGDATMATV